MPHQFRLAQLMCARLCHDLVGPAGTVEGALSLVGTAGAEEAMEVARDALASLRARLTLFRAAWGGGLGDSTLSELLALLDGQVAGGRARVELAAGAALRPDTVLAAPLAQLVLNAVLLGDEALPRGGTVVLAGDPAHTLAVCPKGPSAVWPPGVAAAIAAGGLDPAMPVEARSVRAPVLAALAAELRIPLTLALSGPGATGPAPLLIGPAPAAAC